LKTGTGIGLLVGFALFQSGCATIFGWDIHAPGIFSGEFAQRIEPMDQRIALYLPPELLTYRSTNRGGRFADPQTYHIGESLGPMMVEGFQQGFQEFIFFEVEPTAPILKRYAVSYLAVTRVKGFDNRVTLKGQGVALETETAVFDSDLKLLARFESRGASDAQKIFAKKGGPEVNLNAAIENNVLAIVQYLQDSIRSGVWEKKASP
jgi:hypothetical protein